MDEAEKDAIRARLVALGVDANWATNQALKLGEFCASANINLQTLLLLGLTISAGSRFGLAAELVREVEELHKKVDAETDRAANEARI
jgi:hypothetical protein